MSIHGRRGGISLIVVEARAALAAATRCRRLATDQPGQAKAELAALLGDLHIAEVTDDLIIQAAELAEDEGLHGYDAVHLASALYLEASILTSADTALCEAAARNGLHAANPLLEWS